MKNIGEQIKIIREFKEITQETLAQKSRVDRSLISKTETGVSQGSIDTLQKLAVALGVTVNDLLEDHPPYISRTG